MKSWCSISFIMLVFFILVGLTTVLVAMGLMSLSLAWRFHRIPTVSIVHTSSADTKSSVPTSVIVPCKGDDGTLLENLEGLIHQSRAHLEFVFVTATADDPACIVFEELKRRWSNAMIKTVVAGVPSHCSQKTNNQIRAVEVADPQSEVFVFMDSDGRAGAHFIDMLIAPLRDRSIGATTGYRWYDPRWYSLPDLLRTTWNAGGFAFLVNQKTSFVWGGGMALRRETYEHTGVAELWSRTLVDDLTLSRRLKSRGLRLQFVPECIIISHTKDTWRSLFHWTNRQTFLTRFYNKPFWVVAGIFHGLGNIVGWSLLIVGIVGLATTNYLDVAMVALCGGVLWLLHLWLFALLMISALKKLLRPHGVLVRRRYWVLILLAPLASLIQGINTTSSSSTRYLQWSGITYYALRHDKIRVV